MIIYPAIDLRKCRVVRLEQGRADAETVYFTDPAEPAKAWKAAGAEWVHVVDLDGAFAGEGLNRSAVDSILTAGMKVQLGGGMRSHEAVESALKAGVTRVVIGTRAAEDPNFVGDLVKTFGAEHIAVGIDAKDGLVAIKGWVETMQLDAIDLAKKVEELGCQTIIYTDISRDGMLTGPNLEAQRTMLESVSCRIIASGGVSYPKDLVALRALEKDCNNLDGVITGKAVYEGRIDLEVELKANS
jgi:phosphoribosylformimino-5-aminoimidazole carboxamide ribotide isomerase|tara:strand:- start:1624 stop:2352 length:729 start_codon:yes stop_codon:yes gene_type:complete